MRVGRSNACGLKPYEESVDGDSVSSARARRFWCLLAWDAAMATLAGATPSMAWNA